MGVKGAAGATGANDQVEKDGKGATGENGAAGDMGAAGENGAAGDGAGGAM